MDKRFDREWREKQLLLHGRPQETHIAHKVSLFPSVATLYNNAAHGIIQRTSLTHTQTLMCGESTINLFKLDRCHKWSFDIELNSLFARSFASLAHYFSAFRYSIHCIARQPTQKPDLLSPKRMPAAEKCTFGMFKNKSSHFATNLIFVVFVESKIARRGRATASAIHRTSTCVQRINRYSPRR